jgi:flagellar hook-associated protein 3 FlgL
MTLQISTALFFDRATERISANQNRLATTQARLSVGKQILSPSDAPDQAAAIQRLRGEIDRQDSSLRTLQVAMRRYDAEEIALTSANDLLIRIKELTLQAANDTLSPVDRRAVAIELQTLRDQLVAVGNTRDDSGNYLFSGTRVGTPPLVQDASGRVLYAGDQTQTAIPGGSERSVLYSRTATDVFVRIVRTDPATGERESVGFFDAIDQTLEALRTNQTPAIQRGIDEIDALQTGVSQAMARIGADMGVVQSQIDLVQDTQLRFRTTLSEIEDLDYAQAITRLNQEMLGLEAAMGSFAKISGLTLFDYIGR